MADATFVRMGPLRLSRVLYEEHRHVFPTARIADPGEPGKQADEDARLHDIFGAFQKTSPMALCLSGGGIRSATFGLGVIQGLARHGKLRSFHYLSTVSGGGYIGSWISAWIHRSGIETVEATLAAKSVGTKTSAESPQVDHLRSYSNYLTPRLGLLSADTWALVATVIRNLLLNWLVLVPVLVVVVVLPQLWAVWLAALAIRDAGGSLVPMDPFGLRVAVGLALLAVVSAIAYIEVDLPSGGDRRGRQATFLWLCLLPLVVAAALLTRAWSSLVATGYDPSTGAASGVTVVLRNGEVHWGWFGGLGAAVHLVGWLAGAIVAWRRPRVSASEEQAANGWAPRPWWEPFVQFIGIPFSGALGGVGIWLALRVLPLDVPALVCLGPPVLLLIFFLAMVACIGLISAVTSEDDREWWARCGGWILIAALGWLSVSTVALYGPWVIHASGAWLRAAIVSAGGLGGVATYLAGKSAKVMAGRRADEKSSSTGVALDWAVKIGAPLFLVFLLVVIAGLTEWLPGWWLHVTSAAPPAPAEVANVYLVLLAILTGVCALASRTIDINRFSLHAMYRNRLIRAYLGASRPREGTGRRDPNPFTGLDPKDNLALRDLQREEPPKGFPSADPQLPFHVVNVALNLVKGARLAWQHRKAASFTFTALHGGSAVIEDERHATSPDGKTITEILRGAYQPIAHYGGADGVTIGTALAISGAAVSPNMGYHSSPVVTLLLALFNARLGWWLANPAAAGHARWDKSSPAWALGPYLAEAFGLTDDRSRNVYLSDGGHFENLGLYEMVLRRCHTIVVIDAGCDPKYEFEDLGNAIRKVRIDLGINIDFTLSPPMDTTQGEHVRHFAVGTIHYREVDGDGSENGTLYYVKPVLSGDEPVDVRNYHATHPEFPHETTADQWFDEDQFETYRMLGVHSAKPLCTALGKSEEKGAVAA